MILEDEFLVNNKTVVWVLFVVVVNWYIQLICASCLKSWDNSDLKLFLWGVLVDAVLFPPFCVLIIMNSCVLFFVSFWLCLFFFSFWRITSGIFCRAGLMDMNALAYSWHREFLTLFQRCQIGFLVIAICAGMCYNCEYTALGSSGFSSFYWEISCDSDRFSFTLD